MFLLPACLHPPLLLSTESCWLWPFLFFRLLPFLFALSHSVNEQGIEVTILTWRLFFFMVVKQLTAPRTCPEISHAAFALVHTCIIKLLQKFNQWEVMLPQGGLGWLSGAFENAENSRTLSIKESLPIHAAPPEGLALMIRSINTQAPITDWHFTQL